jgi:hypothetical protein
VSRAEWALATRRRQGLPDHVEDPDALLELADLALEELRERKAADVRPAA